MIIINPEKPASVIALKYQLKRAFSKIKDEFNHHLESINENTNELQANYEYLSELDARIDKLACRLESVEMFLKKLDDSFKVADETDGFVIQPLSVNEKRIFVVIYTSKNFLHYNEIAESLNLPESLVRSYLTNIIEKGVPIIKKYLHGKPVISIDAEFKRLQKEKNILNISQKQLSSF